MLWEALRRSESTHPLHPVIHPLVTCAASPPAPFLCPFALSLEDILRVLAAREVASAGV